MDDYPLLLDRLLHTARAALPEVQVDDAVFRAHLAAHVPRDQPLAVALESVHAAELYLCCGCARGDGAALRIFEQRYLALLPGLLRRIEPSPAALDEICQTLRERLLVGTGGAPPRILEYAGRGTLLGWLRVAAVRTALNQKRTVARQQLDADDLPPEATPDPELELLKRRHRAELTRAFQEALDALPPKARTLLRLHFLDGMNIDRLGALHRVHRATIARWIASYVRDVQAAVRLALARALRAPPEEMDSLVRLVQSQLDLSIRRALSSAATSDLA